MTSSETVIDNELNIIVVDKEPKESMSKTRKISIKIKSILLEVFSTAQEWGG